ncbi:MAG: lipopolysaccharide transport periplasmic protein LptA [Gammaproteobacteria bacterium]
MLHRHKIFLFLFIALPLQLSALPEDRQQPIHLQANKASFDQRSGVSIYEGQVEVTQGTMYLAADKATVYFDQNGVFQRMVAVGGPTRFRYQPARNKPNIDGVGDRIEYNAVTAQVVVTGNARFTQGGDKFQGHRIEYDLTSDVVSATGKSDSGRVEFTIQPRNK